VLRQQHQVQVQLAPTVVCELRLKAPIKNIFIGRVWTVEALAYYSEGPRIVDTATFKCDPMMAEVVITQRSAQDAVDRIVASLTGDGWQMAGSGHLGLPRFERTGKAPETSSRQSATACERKDIVVNLGVIASTPGGSGITKFHALRTTAQKAAAEANPEIRRAVEAEAVGGWEPEGDLDLLALHLAGKVRSRSLWGGMMTWKFSFDSATVSLRRASSAARLSSDY
jgi:hypothetical protein